MAARSSSPNRARPTRSKLLYRCLNEICSRTLSGCAARWTSCSAMSSSGPDSPADDVAYATDPPRAIVTAELAGVELDELELEIQGRTLILAGRRGPASREG